MSIWPIIHSAYLSADRITVYAHEGKATTEVVSFPAPACKDWYGIDAALDAHGFRLDGFTTARHMELSKMPRTVLPSGIRRSA